MDNGFLRQRRNLMAISVALLLFILAQGDINTLFGVRLGNERVAIVFAWLAFFYAAWRYFLYLPNNLSNAFNNDISSALAADSAYQTKAIQALKTKYPEEEKLISFLKMPVSTFFIKSESKYNYHISARDEFKDKIRGGNIPCNNYFLSLRIRARSWLLAIYKGKTFSDYFIPLYLSEITFFVGVNRLYDYIRSRFILNIIEIISLVILLYLIFLLIRPRLIRADKNA